MTRTLTTRRGMAVETTLTDEEAIQLLGSCNGEFAQDLLRKATRYGLSPDQLACAHKLALEAVERAGAKAAPAAGEITAVEANTLFGIELLPDGDPIPVARAPRPPAKTYSRILALLTRAAEHLQWPKLRVDLDGQTVQLSLAGGQSRSPGSVNVTDGGRYGQNVWYGRIAAGDGAWSPSRAGAPPEIVVALDRIEADPVEAARLYGARTGHCCFCGLELTTRESVHAGYGPICAGHWGLPWGEVGSETPTEDREAILTGLAADTD